MLSFKALPETMHINATKTPTHLTTEKIQPFFLKDREAKNMFLNFWSLKLVIYKGQTALESIYQF